MKVKLHFRESLPWFGAAAAWIGAAIGALVALAAFTSIDEDVTGDLGLVAWLAIAPGLALALKAILVILRDLNSRQALLLAGLSVAAFVLAAVLHNVVSALFGIEEAVFFTFATFVAPAVLIAALIRAARPGGTSRGLPA